MDGGDDDDGIWNPADYYHGKDDEEIEFGHETNGSSSSALEYKMNGGRSFAQAISEAINVLANPLPIRAGEWQRARTAPQITSPLRETPKKKPALHSRSFTPMVMNPPPTLDDAIDMEPDFFQRRNPGWCWFWPPFPHHVFHKGQVQDLRAATQGIIHHGYDFGTECAWHTGTLHPEGGKAAPSFFSYIKQFPHTGDDGLELHVSPEFLVASTGYQE